MDRLRQQVRIARRRLVLQQFLWWLPRCWFVSLAVAALALAVPKLIVVSVQTPWWTWGWVGGGLAVGWIAAIVATRIGRKSELDAAVEIDRRCRLKERVSSVFGLSEAELNSPAGQALVQDALRRASNVDVGGQFGVSLDRRAWLPLVPALIAFVLVVFVQDRVSSNPAEAGTTAADKEQVKRSTEQLKKKLEERRKKAEQAGLKDAEGLFKKLEENAQTLAEKDDVDRKQALVKLNDLARELEKRREAVGGAEKMKQQLDKLKDIGQGPADKMAKAMQQGDFNKALEEMKKLQEQLKAGKLDEKQQKELADQLEKMQSKLQQLADAHQQAKEELQQQIQKAKDAGDLDKASQMQEQLDKLNQQQPQMDQLKQMADKLGQAAQNMKQGDAQKAAEAMDQVAQDLKGMRQQLDELEMLDDAMQQLAQAKDAMNCKACAGEGCKECEGLGDEPGQGGMGQGQGEGQGDGMGAGQGEGYRPEKKNDTGAYDTRVRQKIGQGGAVIEDFVDGPNVRGQVLEGIKSEVEASRRETADPLSGQRLPRNHRDHAKEYFDAFREGK